MPLIDWSLNDFDALMEVYSSFLIYALLILFICLFALYYIYFCLLALLILLVVVDAVVVVYSFFIYSTVVFLNVLCLLLFCRLSVPCCLCCHYVLEPCCPFAIIALYLFLLLFSLLTHCISKI